MKKSKIFMLLLLTVFSAGMLYAQSGTKTAKRQKAVKTGASAADTSHAETQTQGNSSGGNAAWPLATGTTGSVTFKPDTTSYSGNGVKRNAEVTTENGAVSGLTSTGSSSTELTGGGNRKSVSPDTADRQKKSHKRNKRGGD